MHFYVFSCIIWETLACFVKSCFWETFGKWLLLANIVVTDIVKQAANKITSYSQMCTNYLLSYFTEVFINVPLLYSCCIAHLLCILTSFRVLRAPESWLTCKRIENGSKKGFQSDFVQIHISSSIYWSKQLYYVYKFFFLFPFDAL